jgi:hypothetical protein
VTCVDERVPRVCHDALLWLISFSLQGSSIGYAMHSSRSHDAVIRVYDAAGNVIETHEHPKDFNEW